MQPDAEGGPQAGEAAHNVQARCSPACPVSQILPHFRACWQLEMLLETQQLDPGQKCSQLGQEGDPAASDTRYRQYLAASA